MLSLSSLSVRCLWLIAGMAMISLVAAESLTIDQALLRAQQVNENAAIARERMIQADGARREAYAELLPIITLSGSYTPWSDHYGEYVNGGAAVSVRLLDPSSIPRLRQATRLVEAERLDAGEIRRNLAFNTANNFYLVLAASSLEQAATKRLEVADEALRQARVRAQAGLVDRSTVTRSELESATARTELIRSRNASLKSRYALFYLLGAQPDQLQADRAWPVLSPPPAASVTAPLFGDLLTEALRLRGDLLAAQARAEAARFAAEEPVTDTLPKFYLRGAADYTDDRARAFGADTTDWRASVVATWELYDGGARYGRRERLSSVAREYSFIAEGSRRRLGLELSNALSDLATAVAAVEQAQVRRTVAQQNADEIGIRFQQGLSTALEQADSNVAAYEAEIELARSRFNHQQANLSLEQAVGRWPAGQKAIAADAKP
jgi:outer membrane protein TolC